MVKRTPSLLVVGSGLTGATIARLAKDANHDVTVLERRAHIGGNVRDEIDPRSGLLIGCYGPHYFRTSSETIWNFVRRFADWYGFSARVCVRAPDGRYHAWPPRRQPNWEELTWRLVRRPDNFEEACLVRMPLPVYRSLVQGYTEKQWGVPATTLSAELARRIDVRRPDAPSTLKRQRWQALPRGGYAKMMAKMLEGVSTVLNTNFYTSRSIGRFYNSSIIVCTGPVDEYFGYRFGKLCYRAQRREHTYHSDANLVNPEVQVNLPDPTTQAIRQIEWKHMLPERERTPGTVVTTEYPFTPNDPDQYEYPFPSDRDQRLYAQYAELAVKEPNTIFAGRLGEYRYLDMDQAIARAMKLWHKKIEPRLREAQ